MICDVEPLSMELLVKQCVKCGEMRKFMKGTPRDKLSICGNCWDWEKEPTYLKLTREEAAKLQKILSLA